MLILRSGKLKIWTVGAEYLVFDVTIGGDPIACPSLSMAFEIATR
jgi:hypothetical protein